jgi:hypothetical protein
MKIFSPHEGETPTLDPEGPHTTNWLHHDEVIFVWHLCRWYLALGEACARVSVMPGDRQVGRGGGLAFLIHQSI